MNKIEQKFFKAFKIEPEIIYEYNFNLSNNPKYSTRAKYVVIDLCKQGYKVESVKIIKLYPTITPEIILRLEDIIINKYYNLILNKAEDDYPYQYETKDLFTDWCKTKEEALLSLCIGCKDEIQDQVKELFYGK